MCPITRSIPPPTAGTLHDGNAAQQRAHRLIQAMSQLELTVQRVALEKRLIYGADFTATYLAVSSLHSLIESHPSIACPQTVDVLESVLSDAGFSSETQAFFLYRQAAEVLVDIIERNLGQPLAEQAMATLHHALGATTGHAHRASAQCLGGLPIFVPTPPMPWKPVETVPQVQWHDVPGGAGMPLGHRCPEAVGRSLVVRSRDRNTMLVVKLARHDHGIALIQQEALWMRRIRCEVSGLPVRFDVPEPVRIQGSYLFYVHDMPAGKQGPPQSGCHAIAFLAHQDYFEYPNDYRPKKRLHPGQFREVMSRNAWLFGNLSGQGMVHSAPIPLFHNRIQRSRRQDRGLYEWQRGGRLDRWLHSCFYPNFGLTGIRDFEHFISFAGSSQQLYNHIGSQLLSLLLTIGSYFRAKDITRVGLDEQGNAVDARDLFDRDLLEELIQVVFLNYYAGFSGKEFDGNPPLRFRDLACRMIEEMGVDRHMEEVLRVADQEGMSESAFRIFLESRGYTQGDITALKKGDRDIVINSGPHLGGFNERISIPELIESVGTMSALCIAGKYWTQHSMPSPNTATTHVIH